jgi:glycosyltransferase involved in cell wall biosynthesis
MEINAVIDLDHLTAEQPAVLRGRDILCFSSDWTGDPLSRTHFMRLLSRHNRVLWVNSIGCRTPSVASKADMSRALKKLASFMEPIREPEPNIFVLSPFAIPFYGRVGKFVNGHLLRWQIVRAMRKFRFRSPINWVANPAAGIIAKKLGESFVVYHCVDEWTAFSGVSSRALGQAERDLLRTADLVIVTSERLFQSKSPENPHTYLVRHGVDFDHFRRALEGDTSIPDEIAELPRPIIGYFGLISQDWIDLELLVKLAERFSHGSLVMLGKIAMDVSPLRALPNVHLLGRKPYESLPAYCKGFDVGIVPFPINEVTLNSNPLKAREYLAAGLPVIATAIPEVEVLGLCSTARDHEEFLRQTEQALRDPGPSRARSETVSDQSWSSKLAEITAYIFRYLQQHTAT